MDPNAPNSTAKPSDLQGTAASTVHDVLERAENAVDEAADKVKPVVSKMPQAAQAPLYGAVHAATDAASSLREGAEELMQREHTLLGAATRYIKANPRKALRIAFIAGFVVGRFLL